MLIPRRFPLFRLLALAANLALSAAAAVTVHDPAEDYQPHTPTLIFYLSNVKDARDAEAIRAALTPLKSVRPVKVAVEAGTVQVRFDSHIVSYHEVAQAIADGGKAVGKKFDPRLKLTVPAYAQNASKVDALFAGKRLNTRVTIEPVDRVVGVFLIHFLPLVREPDVTGPQGFNGGHLNHPLHDPVPRGLGLECHYASEG
jgi:copper chaperone CopZ